MTIAPFDCTLTNAIRTLKVLLAIFYSCLNTMFDSKWNTNLARVLKWNTNLARVLTWNTNLARVFVKRSLSRNLGSVKS